MKNEKWRQKTPKDQFVALWGSIMGEVSNYDDGIISGEVFDVHVGEKLAELFELLPFLYGVINW